MLESAQVLHQRAQRRIPRLDGHEDGKPPATYAIEVHGDSGETTLPLELDDVPYTVRAASADRDGITGPTTSADLPGGARAPARAAPPAAP